MDPNELLDSLIDAVLDGDWDVADALVSDLEVSRQGGALPPRDPRRGGTQIGNFNTQTNHY
jgi:hypothetical protein